MTATSAEPDELDNLLTEALQAAQFFLEKNGEFFPFGVTLTAEGTLNHTQAYTGSEQPSSADLTELLQRGLQEGARTGSYRAIALVSNVSIRDLNETQDAIRVHLEHTDGRCVDCFLPYVQAEPGEGASPVHYGELTAEEADALVSVWARPGH